MPLHRTDRPDCRGGVITIGNFDGVHLGHRAMIGRLADVAAEHRVPAVAITFDPPPVALLRPEKTPPRLTTLSRRAELLHDAGADEVVAYPVTHDVLALTPEQFFDDVIVGRLDAKAVVEGPNFRFGKARAGDVELLRTLADAADIGSEIIPPAAAGGEMVSSTRVRGLLADGVVDAAAALLGRPHEVTGVVVRGAARGRVLGFPTANLDQIETLVPAEGVYAGEARVDDDSFAAAVHIGTNATFAAATPTVEAHLVGFDGDLYGRELTVTFLERLRGTVRFDSPEALAAQLRNDIDRAKAVHAAMTPSAAAETPTDE
ncbi:MAG: bifunctional riboflavin kinase/FAD synthetase [Planctomycetota bacterium]